MCMIFRIVLNTYIPSTYTHLPACLTRTLTLILIMKQPDENFEVFVVGYSKSVPDV